jgi:hypothetical protein
MINYKSIRSRIVSSTIPIITVFAALRPIVSLWFLNTQIDKQINEKLSERLKRTARGFAPVYGDMRAYAG